MSLLMVERAKVELQLAQCQLEAALRAWDTSVSELWRTSIALTEAQERVTQAHELLRNAIDAAEGECRGRGHGKRRPAVAAVPSIIRCPNGQAANRYPIIAGARCAAFVQPIAIFRGWACFAFGTVSVNTPSTRLALILSWSTLFDSVNDRA